MTTILFVFLIALALSLVLTPLAGKLGARFGSLDVPTERSIHTSAIPRSGGLAIITSFFMTLLASHFFATHTSDLLILTPALSAYLLGAVIACGVGIFDDFRRLNPWVKFLFQMLAATVAFYGGLTIQGVVTGSFHIEFGILSYLITVFWFLLLINAVNLIDGLDGLAAGITFFTSLVMVTLSVMKGSYLTAMFFAALGGAVLGFLSYNFNPPTVFMGDGGSYFIGYTIAALSIYSSVKTQVGAAMLIPLVALGIPIFDTHLSPLRRFLIGKEIFRPDKDHIHHWVYWHKAMLGFSQPQKELSIILQSRIFLN